MKTTFDINCNLLCLLVKKKQSVVVSIVHFLFIFLCSVLFLFCPCGHQSQIRTLSSASFLLLCFTNRFAFKAYLFVFNNFHSRAGLERTNIKIKP